MEAKYLTDWEGYDKPALCCAFNLPEEALDDIQILLAAYEYECYNGQAFVLFLKEGQLFEVFGGHCSCYGLEGQFDPEKVILSELENRLKKGSFGDDDYSDNVFKTDLAKFLGVDL